MSSAALVDVTELHCTPNRELDAEVVILSGFVVIQGNRISAYSSREMTVCVIVESGKLASIQFQLNMSRGIVIVEVKIPTTSRKVGRTVVVKAGHITVLYVGGVLL